MAQAWVMLRAMAEEKGLIRDAGKTGRDWPRVEKRMQEIRKALREHFAIWNIPTRNSSDMRASPDPADWRDARSQCHTSVWHDGLSTPKTFPAKHAADSQAPPGTTPGVPLSGSR